MLKKMWITFVAVLVVIIFVAAPLIMFMMAGPIVEAAVLDSSSQITLRTAGGGVLGYLDGKGSGKRAVRAKDKSILGWIDNNGTYKKNKSKIAGSPLPGLLFCK